MVNKFQVFQPIGCLTTICTKKRVTLAFLFWDTRLSSVLLRLVFKFEGRVDSSSPVRPLTWMASFGNSISGKLAIQLGPLDCFRGWLGEVLKFEEWLRYSLATELPSCISDFAYSISGNLDIQQGILACFRGFSGEALRLFTAWSSGWLVFVDITVDIVGKLGIWGWLKFARVEPASLITWLFIIVAVVGFCIDVVLYI